jgi:hypothetical protein
MLHLLSSAINPRLDLARCLLNWHDISTRLKEPPRRRILQVESLDEMFDTLS